MKKVISWTEKYEELSELGKGGNATVYRVKSKENGEIYALKHLLHCAKEKKCRFADEINVIKKYSNGIGGIIPILDYSLEDHWYVMPVAKPIMEHIEKNKLDIKEIVLGIIELCETLEKLHAKKVFHRDIKPANIFYHDGRFCLADFGLASFSEDKEGITLSNKALGAIFTIAPEMKRNPKYADGAKADVFSLAKTMWMFLTNNEKGFDGVYSYLDHTHSLRYMKKYLEVYTVEIEELLRRATDNDPDKRPSVSEFKETLKRWIAVFENFYKSQESSWEFLVKQLFGSYIPVSSSWEDINQIVEILNMLGNSKSYSHMFFHDMGGNDFLSAEIAAEKDCIKIYTGSKDLKCCYVVKPKKLYFEGFAENFEWNYFLLELESLSSISDKFCYFDYELLVEDSPGHYVSGDSVQYGVYDYETGTPLPSGFQEVCRYKKGKLLFVMKVGPYNIIDGTYDGRHGDCSASEFREYTEQLVKIFLEKFNVFRENPKYKDLSDRALKAAILNSDVFNTNPFNPPDSEESMIEAEERKRIVEEREKSMAYMNENFGIWDFSEVIRKQSLKEQANIKFAFNFNKTAIGIDLWARRYLCKNGHIQKLESFSSDENCFFVYDREEAISFKKQLTKRIETILKAENLITFEEYEHYFEIELARCGSPKHLFTKEEIETAMRNADDRVNNQLIIDENGYAQIIQNSNRDSLYPVRHGIWNAGNVYVGKYSKLTVLEDCYLLSLKGWLQYLETGYCQYAGAFHPIGNEEEIIKKIKAYY